MIERADIDLIGAKDKDAWLPNTSDTWVSKVAV
jgi:hypothetical protein